MDMMIRYKFLLYFWCHSASDFLFIYTFLQVLEAVHFNLDSVTVTSNGITSVIIEPDCLEVCIIMCFFKSIITICSM